MPLQLLNSTNVFRKNISKDYVEKINSMQKTLDATHVHAYPVVSRLMIDYFDAMDVDDHDRVKKLQVSMENHFKAHMDKRVDCEWWKKRESGGKGGYPLDLSFEFLMFILETVACELNVVKPDTTQVVACDERAA